MSSLTYDEAGIAGPAAAAERALHERLHAADARVIAELYDAHHASIRGLAQRLTGDADAAEDLVHEVFVALPPLLRCFRGQSSLRTFLFGVAVNHARHYVRAAARRRAAAERYAREPPAERAGPELELERRRLAADLQRHLDALPLAQRVAFVLCEVEQLDSRRVAEVLGVPEGTVRTRLFHAKRKLRAAFEAENP
jgi:RNA polymerase sigma-70 factor (ECF subfamily)